MGRYLLVRLGEAVVTLLVIAMAIFGLLHLIPGSPVYAILGHDATPKAVAQLNALLGLNLPIWDQFGRWLQATLFSAQGGQVLTRLLPVTLELLGFSSVIAFGLACVVALVQVLHPRSLADRVLTALTYGFYGFPAFWLGLVLIWLVGLELLWLPPNGWPGALQPGLGSWVVHLIMPVATLALTTVGGWSRYLRASMEEALQTDYVRTARAKGASERRILVRHAFRNSLLPLITLTGISLPTLMNSVIVVEVIFYIPGAGAGFLQALDGLVFSTATTIAFFLAVVTVLGNVVADACYSLADPRIQYN